MTAPKTKRIVSAPAAPAHVPISPEAADFHAIHAMIRCDATPEQQRRFVLWFNKATGVSENSFRPGEDGRRETDFALGKKFVGDQFWSIAKTQLSNSQS